MMEFQRSNAVVEVRWKESIEGGVEGGGKGCEPRI
jgi:hypothetical protein